MMPFMFRVGEKFIVQIHAFAYGECWVGWMLDEQLGEECLEPEPDGQVGENNIFATETEALRFIQNWWKTQQL